MASLVVELPETREAAEVKELEVGFRTWLAGARTRERKGIAANIDASIRKKSRAHFKDHLFVKGVHGRMTGLLRFLNIGVISIFLSILTG